MTGAAPAIKVEKRFNHAQRYLSVRARLIFDLVSPHGLGKVGFDAAILARIRGRSTGAAYFYVACGLVFARRV